jgi:hypothetical protein
MLKVLKPSTPTFVSSTVAEPASSDPSSAWSVSNAYAAGDTVYVAGTEHRRYECTAAHQGTATSSATVTMTIAVPCVVTWNAHGKANNTAVVFSTTGALPTGLTVGTTYYVTAAATNTFQLSATMGGAAITTTGTQTGTHTCRTTSTAPVDRLTGTDPLWIDLGPTNRHAMFDSMMSTQTTLTTSVGSPVLEVVVSPGICNGVAVLDVTGVVSVKCEMFNGATLVYTDTKSVDNTFISNWYEYFFEPYDVYTDLLFGPLPPYPSATVKLTFTPTAVGATIKCGAALYGNTVEIGDVEYGATAGITDYSRKETDEFGITTLVERGFSKHTSYNMQIPNTQLRRVFSTLAALRATPAVWVASEDSKFTPLTAFGYPKDWGINVQYADYSSVSLEVEGML